MKRRGIALLSAAVLGLLASLALATPAQAAECDPVIDKVTPSGVVIFATTPSRLKVTVTAHDPCTTEEFGETGIWDVNADAYLRDGSWEWVDFNDTETHNSSKATWTGYSGAYFNKYSAIGQGKLNVEVYDQDVNRTFRDGIPFYVRRNVTISSYNAGPEPVRKGSPVKVKGYVKRLSVNSYGDTRYVPYTSHAVNIYFRPKTSTTYSKVGTVYTTSTGYFAKSITATVDGYWKAYSTQTVNHVGRWSTADFVDVI